MAKGDLFVAIQPGSIGLGEGDYVMLNVGDVAEAGHPVMAGREGMFAPMPVRFRLGDGQAEAEAPAAAPAPKAQAKPERGAQEPQDGPETSVHTEGKGEAGKSGSGSGAASVGLTSGDAPGAKRPSR